MAYDNLPFVEVKRLLLKSDPNCPLAKLEIIKTKENLPTLEKRKEQLLNRYSHVVISGKEIIDQQRKNLSQTNQDNLDINRSVTLTKISNPLESKKFLNLDDQNKTPTEVERKQLGQSESQRRKQQPIN